MADFKAGDRVVKMSGVGAGKYGTVNSVMENGTLNVTFDGERLPKYCDPMRCGQVATNAGFKFKVGDKAILAWSRPGAGETVTLTRKTPAGLFEFRMKDGGEGQVAEKDLVPASFGLYNSRATNAKFKVGQKVRHKTNGLTGVIEGSDSEPGNYNVRSEGRVFMWDEDDLVRANGCARNAERVARNDSSSDAEVLSAYRKGCAGIASKIHAELLKLKAYVAANEGLHSRQQKNVRDNIEAVLGSELDVSAVKGMR